MKQTIKACPFCGRNNRNKLKVTPMGVKCHPCSAWGPSTEKTDPEESRIEEGIRLWNTRASDGLIEELIGVLSEAEEYFEGRADAEYFTDSPSPFPNDEMRHFTAIGSALTRARESGYGGEK